MRSHRRSDTALLIARAILLAEATPALRALVIEGSAAVARRLLGFAEPARGVEFALRYRAGRAFLFALERCLLPGIVLHWLARKRRLVELARDALRAGCTQVVILGTGLDSLAWRLRKGAGGGIKSRGAASGAAGAGYAGVAVWRLPVCDR